MASRPFRRGSGDSNDGVRGGDGDNEGQLSGAGQSDDSGPTYSSGSPSSARQDQYPGHPTTFAGELPPGTVTVWLLKPLFGIDAGMYLYMGIVEADAEVILGNVRIVTNPWGVTAAP